VVVQHAHATFPIRSAFRHHAGGGLGANNHYPMSGETAKRVVIPNTVSGSLGLGRAVLHARQTGKDPVAVVARETGGRVAFVGEITALQEEEALGFYFTTASIAGSLDSRPHGHLVIKNETMFLAIDDRPRAYFPDLVLMLEPSTGRGWMSVELRVGSPLALVLVPCHPRLRRAVQSGTADEAFSPARYGRPQDHYRPLEALGN
jgi:DUF917 family protein